MREILFRGKWLGDGTWLEGNLRVEHYPEFEDMPERWRCSIYVPDVGKPWSCSIFDVDPETVGQYTGLKDRNGKTIFEGDIILDTSTGEKYEILCNYGGFVMADKNRFFHGLSLRLDADYEIVGNIYDNPELMGSCPCAGKFKRGREKA